MSGPLSDAAHKATIDSVKAEKPSRFTVGGWTDGRYAEGGVTFNRKWSNLWGFTAYAKAYWNDQPVIPTDRFGGVVGFDLEKKF